MRSNNFLSGNANQPKPVEELVVKLRVMLDKRRPSSKTNVIDFSHAADRSRDAVFLEEYQALTGMVTDYFFKKDGTVSYEDYHYLKEGIGELQKSIKGKEGASPKANEKVGEFTDISSRIRVAGIEKLSKSQLEQAYMAAQQLEQELQKQLEESAGPSEAGQADIGASDAKDSDEIKTEKELAMQAQLPFKKSQKLLMQLKSDLENALRARATQTPTPGMS